MQMSTPVPSGYCALLAKIEWLENGEQAPALPVDLKELLAALADMKKADERSPKRKV